MKQYLIKSKRFTAAIIALALVAGALITPQLLEAQTATQKVRLMADTLRARDSGNLDLAKQKAEELIIIAPQDENVQRLLASINQDLESQIAGSVSTEPAVFGQAEAVSVEEAMEAGLTLDSESDGAEAVAAVNDGIIAAAAAEQAELIEAADAAITQAYLLADLGEFSAANTELNNTAVRLPRNTATASIFSAIEEAKLDIILSQAKTLATAGDLKAAESMLDSYREAGGDTRKANALARSLNKEMSNPYNQDIAEVSPQYVAQAKIIRDLLTRGRAQFLSGDYDGAQATFKEVEARDANNSEAKLLQTRIARILGDVHQQTRYKTRAQMLTEVDQSWERPKVFDIAEVDPVDVVDAGLREKLNNIIIPEVKFTGVELTRVLETLSELSAVYDPNNDGINIVPIFKPSENNPKVSITLRKLSLDRVLEFVTQQVNFSYDVGSDVVTVQPSDGLEGVASMITQTFNIPTSIRTAIIGVDRGGATQTVNPFAAPTTSSGGSTDDTAEKFKSFFQRAGVNFGLTGTDLAYTDDGTLYATQTKRNLERMKNLLRSMDQVKQVEIEAKFLEVAQNDLDEFGFNWGVSDGPQTLIEAGFPVPDQFGNPSVEYQRRGQTQGRTINNAFSTDTATSSINISGFDPISVAPPTLNTAIDLASGSGDLFNASGWSVLGADIQMAIRALSRKASTDVMSAPKVTVMSGIEAQITVAQELRYPESYGEIQSEVGNGGGNNNNNNGGGSGSAISITAATPEEFVTRNVGVELTVKPTVEEDDTISLTLSPSVTEFEGFVEYGGPSVAIAPGNAGILDPITGILTGGTDATVVTVPAGFYQPIFSTRRISTTVSVYDGATLVMGGLTRDEVKSFSDKVPILGNIPGVGRLFRSEGETRQKRNLLIFVTANIVSPGGSPSNQDYRNVKANSLYQNPTIMTPSGSVNRNIDDLAE